MCHGSRPGLPWHGSEPLPVALHCACVIFGRPQQNCQSLSAAAIRATLAVYVRFVMRCTKLMDHVTVGMACKAAAERAGYRCEVALLPPP